MADDKAGDWLETTVHELEEWAARRGDQARPVDVAGARLLLELAQQDLGVSAPEDLSTAVLEALLVEVFPESVFVTVDEIPAVLATGDELLAFLGETGRLPAERAGELRTALAGLEPRFTEAVVALNAAEQEAAAEILSRMMSDDGIDPRDEGSVERWVREFEALPEEERFSRTAGYLLAEDELDDEDLFVAPVRLAPLGELHAAARSSGLFDQVARLAAWTGERPVTEEGVPTLDDEIALAKALGFDPELDLELELLSEATGTPDGGPEGLSENALPLRLWRAALRAGVLVIEDGTAGPGPARRLLDQVVAGTGAVGDTGDGGPVTVEATLELWFQLLDGVLRPAHELHGRSTLVEIVNHEMPSTLLHLYEHRGPCPRHELADGLAHVLEDEYGAHDSPHLPELIEAVLVNRFADLARWGAAEETGEGYLLTPLGVWAVRESLLAEGFIAPVVGELATVPARELVDGLAFYDDDSAAEEIGGWVAAHQPAEAAAGLLEVMAGDSPGDRNLAAAALQRLDDEAAPAVREGLADPLVRPYAVMWLRSHGDETAGLSAEETHWLLIDSVAGLLESGADAEEAVPAAVAEGAAQVDLGAMCDQLWRVDHPDTARVLDALGAHHPDKKVAKAARTAAFKARSRNGVAAANS